MAGVWWGGEDGDWRGTGEDRLCFGGVIGADFFDFFGGGVCRGVHFGAEVVRAVIFC